MMSLCTRWNRRCRRGTRQRKQPRSRLIFSSLDYVGASIGHVWLVVLPSSWVGPRRDRRLELGTHVSSFCVFEFQILILRFSVSPQASYLILHKYEPENFFAVSGLVLVPPSVVAWICRVVQKQSSPVPASIFAAYLSLLLGYTILYRVSPSHPLARYPGPPLARVSKLFMVGIVIKGHAHQYYRGLHEKYGDIVRTGARLARAFQRLFTEARCG